MMYRVIFSKQAIKDLARIKQAGLLKNVKTLVSILEQNPFANPPPYEKLVGNLLGNYSRRINIQHRLIYEVMESEKCVRILRLWTHYE